MEESWRGDREGAFSGSDDRVMVQGGSGCIGVCRILPPCGYMWLHNTHACVPATTLMQCYVPTPTIALLPPLFNRPQIDLDENPLKIDAADPLSCDRRVYYAGIVEGFPGPTDDKVVASVRCANHPTTRTVHVGRESVLVRGCFHSTFSLSIKVVTNRALNTIRLSCEKDGRVRTRQK